jgi:hypothetical protein
LVTANPGETSAPIKPYTAVGLIPTVRGIRKRADIRVNLEHLRHLEGLRTELYQILYETPIYPKNLYLERAPMKHAEYRNEVILKQIAQMHSRGVWANPGR